MSPALRSSFSVRPTSTVIIAAWLLLAATWRGTPAAALAQETSADETTVAQVGVGFDGRYKVGYWTPVTVTLRGGAQSNTGAIELFVPDGDGVQTRVTTTESAPVQTMPGLVTSPVMMYAKFGRAGGGLRVRFVVDGKIRAERDFRSYIEQDERSILYALPSTDELILTLGPSVGIAQAVLPRSSDKEPSIHVVRLPDVSALPTRWYGYEAVDSLILSTSQPEIYRKLLSGGARVEALKKWVRLGGRLVMFVGAQADEILDESSPLTDLAPGVFAGPQRMAQLRQTRALEAYCNTNVRIDTGDGNFRLDVPLLADISGNIEAYNGNRPTDLPLVIRSAYGFGEVVFVALDLDRPPFSLWKGRPDFLRKVLRRDTLQLDDEDENQAGRFTMLGYSDLVGQLRHALEQFQGVTPAPFGLVAALVCLYILLIGPGDYFLVKKFLKRMELTWITFPTIVVAVSVGAYYLAYWMKGDELRVNQVELVDVDLESGLVRGTTWTQIFSPKPDAYNLSLSPQLPDGRSPDAPQVLLSWLGLPSTALGGMPPMTPLFSHHYSFSGSLDALGDVPIQVWSTKSITARWTSSDQVNLTGDLHEEIDEMLSGEIVNTLGVDLVECRLFYDRWLYTFATLEDGGRQALGNSLAPKTIKTWLGGRGYNQSSQDVPTILNFMMFGEAAESVRGTRLVNRYQSFCDLSDHLKVGRAILVARVAQGDAPTHGSQLLRDGKPMAGPEDRRWVFYRFVFPVQRDR